MNFGHYCCLTRDDVLLISSKKSLWCNFSSTVKKFTKKLDSIPCIRGKRYVQPSKMSFVNLVIHELFTEEGFVGYSENKLSSHSRYSDKLQKKLSKLYS